MKSHQGQQKQQEDSFVIIGSNITQITARESQKKARQCLGPKKRHFWDYLVLL